MRRAAALSLLFVATGCASMSDVLAERDRGGGVVRSYAAPAQLVHAEARPALLEAGADEVTEHREYFAAESGMSLFSMGAVGALFLEPTGPYETRVTVVVKRRVATSIVIPFDEDDVHRRLATRLSRRALAPVPAPSARPGGPVSPPPPPPAFTPPPGTI